MSIIRELFTKLGLDVDAKAFAEGELAVEGVKKGLELLVDVIVDTSKEFVEMVRSAAESGEAIENHAQMTGLAADEYQRLARAADIANTSQDSLDHGLITLSRTMALAKAGGDEQTKAFAKAGVKYKDANGHLRSAADVMKDLADHFAETKDGAEKTALSMALLGRSGSELIPFLNKGGDELERLGATGQVMTEEQIKASSELVGAQRELGRITKDVWREAVYPLIPAIRDLVQQYVEWRKANADVMKQRIRAVLSTLLSIIRTMGSVLRKVIDNWVTFAALFIGGAVALGLQQGIALMKMLELANIRAAAAAVAAAARTAAAWVVAAAPFILIGGLIAALMLVLQDIRVYQRHGKSLFGRFKTEIDEWLKPKKDDPWWLAAVKHLVEYMERALGLADKLGLAGKGGNGSNPLTPKTVSLPGVGKAQVPAPYIASPGARNADNNYGLDPDKLNDPNSWESRYLRARQAGRGNMGASFAAYGWFGMHAPEAPSAGPSMAPGSGVLLAPQIGSVTFQTTVGPGQDPKAVAAAQRAEWETWWNEKMEGAMAGAGY